jgi:MFS family permease
MAPISLRRQVKRSLKLSTLDGIAFSAMAGLTQNYITPFALALKATTTQIGFLASVPNLTMALSQLAAPNLSEKAGSRKGLILPVVLTHALLWLPILLVPYLFPEPKIWWLIVFITLSGIFGSLANPAWGSMMADLVPMKLRGRYFSFRGRIIGFIALIFSFIGGAILQVFTDNGFLGFTVIFGGAIVFRLLSFYFLSRMYEPPLSGSGKNKQSLPDIVRHMGSSNLGRFTIYVASISFATNLAGPFFAVYMLRDLGLSYMNYIILVSSNAIANLIFQPFWGRRADRFGNIQIVKTTSYLMPFVPLLWLVSSNLYYLILAEIYSGFVWSGFTLATTNFVYDASDPNNRTKHISVYNAVNGVTTCIGALIGGFLAPHLPAIFGYNLRTLFTISGIMRGIVVLLLLRLITEVRNVPKMNAFHVLLSRPGYSTSLKKQRVIYPDNNQKGDNTSIK